MKKTYIAPELELTQMDATDIIATSMESLHNVNGVGSILGRESMWEDEEF